MSGGTGYSFHDGEWPRLRAIIQQFSFLDIGDDGSLRFISLTITGNLVIADGGWIGSKSQPLAIQIDASGNIVMLYNLAVTGDISAANLNISGGIIIPNDGYIGSVGEPQAFRIDSTGNIVMSQGLAVTGDGTFESLLVKKAGSTGVIVSNTLPANDNALALVSGGIANAFMFPSDSGSKTFSIQARPLANILAAQVNNTDDKFRIDNIGHVSFGNAVPVDSTIRVLIKTEATDVTPLRLKGIAGQTADMFDIVDESNNVKCSIDKDGNIIFKGTAGLPFGEVHQTDGATFNVTMATVNAWVEVDAATTNINATELNLCTFPDDHYILCEPAGKYLVTYSFTAEIDSVAGGDQHIESGIMVNGAIQTNKGTGHEQYAATSKEENLQGHTIIDSPANGRISLAIKNTTSSGKALTIDHLNITTLQVGGT